MVSKVQCPSDKILNPKTMRCVLKTGAIGKKLLSLINDNKDNKKELKKEDKKKDKTCPPDKILNPKTMNCVLKTGAIGKKLLKEFQVITTENKKTKSKTPIAPIEIITIENKKTKVKHL